MAFPTHHNNRFVLETCNLRLFSKRRSKSICFVLVKNSFYMVNTCSNLLTTFYSKLRFSENVKKIFYILTLLNKVTAKMEIFKKFVAVSEYIYFKKFNDFQTLMR